jgi:sugar phosphate isomerase/epimerase
LAEKKQIACRIFNYQEENVMKMRLGVAVNAFTGWLVDPRQPEAERARHLAAIRSLASQPGVQVVELSADFTTLYPQVFDRGFYQQVAALQDELSFACTAHLPFLWLDHASLAEVPRRASVEAVRATVEAMAPLRLETYVLHLWGAWSNLVRASLPPPQRSVLEAVLVAQAQRSLREVAEFVPRPALCIENLETVPFAVIVNLAEVGDTRICLDVGHLAWSSDQSEDPAALVRAHHARIAELHLHDVRREPGGEIRDHQAVGAGGLDFPALFQALSDVSFAGPLVLELLSPAAALASLEQVRQLWPV